MECLPPTDIQTIDAAANNLAEADTSVGDFSDAKLSAADLPLGTDTTVVTIVGTEIESEIIPPVTQMGNAPTTTEKDTDGPCTVVVSSGSVNLDSNSSIEVKEANGDDAGTPVTKLADGITKTRNSDSRPEQNHSPDHMDEPTDIMKDRRFEEDIDEGLLTLTTARYKRRGEHPKLKRGGIRLHNLCLQYNWVHYTPPIKEVAIERCVANNKATRCRWVHKSDKKGIYTEAHILLYFETKKKIHHYFPHQRRTRTG